MSGSGDPFTDTAEFEDDAGYGWWRDSHPDGFILTVRARHPPLLHHATCKDVDRDQRRGLKAKGSRQICSDTKSALRAWVSREMPGEAMLVARCPKCGP